MAHGHISSYDNLPAWLHNCLRQSVKDTNSKHRVGQCEWWDLCQTSLLAPEQRKVKGHLGDDICIWCSDAFSLLPQTFHAPIHLFLRSGVQCNTHVCADLRAFWKWRGCAVASLVIIFKGRLLQFNPGCDSWDLPVHYILIPIPAQHSTDILRNVRAHAKQDELSSLASQFHSRRMLPYSWRLRLPYFRWQDRRVTNCWPTQQEHSWSGLWRF